MRVKEEDIRPENVFNEYLELAAADVKTFFGDVKRIEIACPACGSPGEPWADKSGFSYKKCANCSSIFVSPRPDVSAFMRYYTDSPSTKFWATTFYKVTEDARREKLWKPKAKLVKQKIEDIGGEVPVKYVVDIGGGYGVFDEEIRKISCYIPVVVEPSVYLAEICRQKGLDVVEKFMESIVPSDLPEGRKCFVSFELFEHLHDPRSFLEGVYHSMKEDDIFIFTTLSGMGLDILELGVHAKAVSPPHHLNFFNPKSATLLLRDVGFFVVEANTPGKLDVDILNNGRSHLNKGFWRSILDYLNPEELAAVQDSIASLALSSHMMVTAIRK